MNSCSLRLFAAAVLAVTFSLRVGAQDAQDVQDPQDPHAEEPPAQYTSLIEEGLSESSVQHWVEARATFRRAHALFPNARTLRAIGMTSYELRDYPEAFRMFRAALADTRRALTESQRAEVVALLERTEALIGRYSLEAFPPDAIVRVDGVTVRIEPGEELLLSPGTHHVDIRVGDERSVGDWTVQGGENGPLPVTRLDPNSPLVTPNVVASTATLPPRAPMTPTRRRRIWIGTGVATAGAALSIVGAVFVVRGRDEISNVDDAAQGTAWSSVSSDYESGPRNVRIGSGVLGASAASIAGGLVLATIRPREDRAVALRVGRGTLAVHGRF